MCICCCCAADTESVDSALAPQRVALLLHLLLSFQRRACSLCRAVLCCAVLFLPLLWQAGTARHRSAELRAGRIPARLFRRPLLPLSIFVAELQRGGARFASFAPIPRSPLTPHQSLDSRVRSLSPVTNFLRLRTSAQLSIARSGSAQAPAQLGPLFWLALSAGGKLATAAAMETETFGGALSLFYPPAAATTSTWPAGRPCARRSVVLCIDARWVNSCCC